LASGENPYTHAPDSIKLDHVKYDQRSKIGYPQLSSIYPPFAQIVFLIVSPLKHKYALFSLQLIFYLLLIWIIPFWFKESDKYFLILLPFLFKEFIQSVHIDLVAVIFFTLGMNFKNQKQFHIQFIMSFLTKIVSIIMLTYYLITTSSKQNVVAYFITPLLLLIFLYFNHSDASGSSEFIKRWHWNSFLMDTLLYFDISTLVSRFILLALFIVSYPYLLYRAVKNQKLLIVIFTSFLLFSPVLHPWYLLWLIPLVRDNKIYYLAIVSSVLAYAPYGFDKISIVGTFITFLILLSAVIFDLRSKILKV
jgi:hypothetical protein